MGGSVQLPHGPEVEGFPGGCHEDTTLKAPGASKGQNEG